MSAPAPVVGVALQLSHAGDQHVQSVGVCLRGDSRDTALGEPRRYAPFGTWLELYPSPDTSYTIQLRYGAKLPTISLATEVPVSNGAR